MEDIKKYIKQVKPVTRYYMGLCFLMSFCVTYKIVSVYAVLLDWKEVWNNY
jgi:hypothetical protein